MPADPSAYSTVRNYLYLSKFPDKPLQIRNFLADYMSDAIFGKQSVPRNIAGAVVHLLQISSIVKPLDEMSDRFTAACLALKLVIRRQVVMSVIPGGVIARFASTGLVGDKLLIDIVFKQDRGVLEIVYKAPPPQP